jgi:hypothetical protein
LALVEICMLQQSIAAGFEAELEEELALRHRAERSQTGHSRLSREIGKVDMGGEIGLTRSLERIRELMTTHGL